MHQRLAEATLMIVCGNNVGSGFLFKKDNIVVTNHHVISEFFKRGEKIFIATESSAKHQDGYQSDVIAFDEEYDYAVLQLKYGPLPGNPVPLNVSKDKEIVRGRGVIFAGFPHGITDLLVHEAIISGPLEQHAFYIDGMVNGGNSGGPIVDSTSGDLIGIVTQRRFIGEAEANYLASEANAIAKDLMPSQTASMGLMGVDFGALTKTISQGMAIIPKIISLNANSGIGIGFKIEFVDKVVND